MRLKKCHCIIVLIFCLLLSGCSSFQEGFEKGYEEGREAPQEQEQVNTP